MTNTGLLFLSYNKHLTSEAPCHRYKGIGFLIFSEHLIIILLGVLSFMRAPKSADLQLAEEKNRIFMDELLYKHEDKADVQRGNCEKLGHYDNMPHPEEQYEEPEIVPEKEPSKPQ